MDPVHLAVALNKCPVCGKGELFKGWLTLHETCSVCGARYFRDPGNWTAPTAFGYGVGVTVAMLTMVILWVTDNFFSGVEFLIIGVAVAATLGTYRHVKAFWVAVLTRMGKVYPDPVEEPPAAAPEDAGVSEAGGG